MNMKFRGKSIKGLDESDMQNLIDVSVGESLSLEFKDSIDFGSDGKREFLADVISLANSQGGHILLGIAEGKGDRKGVATNLTPLEITDLDSFKQNINNLVRDSVLPMLPTLSIDFIPSKIYIGKQYVVVGVPVSYLSPHIAVKGVSWRTYRRNVGGKEPIEYSEFKRMIRFGDTAIEELRSWRNLRIESIAAGNAPVPVWDAPFLAFHIVPMNALRGRVFQLDIEEIKTKFNDVRHFLSSSHLAGTFNFDGYLMYDGNIVRFDESNGYKNFTQVYRDGKIEAVSFDIIRDLSGMYKELGLDAVEDRILRYMEKILPIMQDLGVESPCYFMLSLCGTQGMKGLTGRSYDQGLDKWEIQTKSLILPEVQFTYDKGIAEQLQPMFDMLWNAFGYPSH